MSFLKGLIDKVEGGSSNHQHQNAPHSNPHGQWPQQSPTDFDRQQQGQYYGGAPFQGQPPMNPYQHGYPHQGPQGPNYYQEGYGHPEYNQHQGPTPPYAHHQPAPYGNYGQQGMMPPQWNGEHHRSNSPRQFEGSEREYHHREGHGHGHDHHNEHHEEYRHERSHSREENKHHHGHHQEHRRERSHSRD